MVEKGNRRSRYIMRRKLVRILMPLFMAAVLLAGCQKAPETANDDEILRAKCSSDDAV